MEEQSLLTILRELSEQCERLRFPEPVSHVYNPLEYAREPHDRYCRQYGNAPRDILVVGMNPGPWGMVQTGVPFGSVSIVREWLGITGSVEQPVALHPKRPILGFSCTRQEVSGMRLWGWAKDRFGSPDVFFSRFFVVNYCPLAFFDELGRNLTPDKFHRTAREQLFHHCDTALRKTLSTMECRTVLAVGAFVRKRLEGVCDGLSVNLVTIPHPSPANPQANRGWSEQIDRILSEQGILP